MLNLCINKNESEPIYAYKHYAQQQKGNWIPSKPNYFASGMS